MAFARRFHRFKFAGRILTAILFGLCFTGCAVVTAPDQTLTPTPNPTLLAISRMLTETRAVPTSTRTPTLAPTRAVTPSQTIEIPVTGDRKLPAPAGARFATKSGSALTILSVETVKSLSRLKALEGSAFFDIEVLVENQTGQPISYNPLDFRLVEPGGELVQPSVDALAPALLSGDLQPGEWVRGHIAFPIAEAEIPSLVRYHPVLETRQRGEDTWFELAPLQSQANAIKPDIPGQQDWPGTGFTEAGGRQEEKGIALTIEKLEAAARLPIRKAEKGMRFITLSVKIENIDHTRTPYNPLYFRVKDVDGYEYLPVVGSPETSLQAGSLGRGQMVRNTIIFEIPETARTLIISYLPTVLADEYAPIRSILILPATSTK
jgi:hypothetical protein